MRLLTLRSILLATDAGETSRPAIRTAARLAELSGAALHLLHVSGDDSALLELELRDRFRDAIPGAPDPETLQLIPGSAAEVIVDQAVRLEADVIVLGPHRRADSGGALGSTAARVVRTAPCPCLVAATELRLPLERILVPIDLSEIASGALSVALSWGSALRPPGGRAQLSALHVAADAATPSVKQAIHEEVARASSRAGGPAHVEIREELRAGEDAVGEILRMAADERTDLLVMGTRGSAGSARGLGSVSDAVARSTPSPLLLVPAQTWEKQAAS